MHAERLEEARRDEWLHSRELDLLTHIDGRLQQPASCVRLFSRLTTCRLMPHLLPAREPAARFAALAGVALPGAHPNATGDPGPGGQWGAGPHATVLNRTSLLALLETIRLLVWGEDPTADVVATAPPGISIPPAARALASIFVTSTHPPRVETRAMATCMPSGSTKAASLGAPCTRTTELAGLIALHGIAWPLPLTSVDSLHIGARCKGIDTRAAAEYLLPAPCWVEPPAREDAEATSLLSIQGSGHSGTTEGTTRQGAPPDGPIERVLHHARTIREWCRQHHEHQLVQEQLRYWFAVMDCWDFV